MRIEVFTIFPSLVDGFLGESLLGRGRDTGLLDCACTTCGPPRPTPIDRSTTRPSVAGPAWC